MIRRIKKRAKHRVTIVDMGSDFGIGPKFVAFMRNKPRRKRYEPAPIKRKSQRGPGAGFARRFYWPPL